MSIYKSEHTDQPGKARRFLWYLIDHIFGHRNCGSSMTGVTCFAMKYSCCLPRWHHGKHSNEGNTLRWGYGDDLGAWWSKTL